MRRRALADSDPIEFLRPGHGIGIGRSDIIGRPRSVNGRRLEQGAARPGQDQLAVDKLAVELHQRADHGGVARKGGIHGHRHIVRPGPVRRGDALLDAGLVHRAVQVEVGVNKPAQVQVLQAGEVRLSRARQH